MDNLAQKCDPQSEVWTAVLYTSALYWVNKLDNYQYSVHFNLCPQAKPRNYYYTRKLKHRALYQKLCSYTCQATRIAGEIASVNNTKEVQQFTEFCFVFVNLLNIVVYISIKAQVSVFYKLVSFYVSLFYCKNKFLFCN